MKRGVRQIVADKRAWQEPLAEAEATREREVGSLGWHTRGYLPHFDKPGLVQMITYRLADAMPAQLRAEWEVLLAREDLTERRRELEDYLDRGHGECWLRHPKIAKVVADSLRHFDGCRYRLLSWVIMPNHVHTLVELTTTPMNAVVKSWKGYTATVCNRLLGREGRFWQPEYWDRYIRDSIHLRRSRRYIEFNPVKARLARSPEDWPFGSAFYDREGSPGQLVQPGG